jgi:hypothetical protein
MTDRAWITTRKGLVELRRGPTNAWGLHRTHFLGDPVTAVLPPADGRPLIAALNLGHFGVKLHASDDGGDHWREVATPTYPPQPPDLAPPPRPDDPIFADLPPPTVVPWKLVQVWTLEGQGPTVWAGTLPGGLFRSDDGGASWALDRGLWDEPSRSEWFGGGYDVPGLHSVCPHPQRPGELIVGISSGGAWLNPRQGAPGSAWAVRCSGLKAAYMPPERAEDPRVQDPHRIVRCAAQPEVLWCQHHNGIWRSTDNATHWVEITSAPVSNFGFAVAAHPRDPLTAWFVPAVKDERRVPVDGALVVQRTRDGGASFEVLRQGLPQRDSFDLVYRHGLDVDDRGESLLMGSTTGHLWASDDAGEHWTLALGHLPPIAGVRFG